MGKFNRGFTLIEVLMVVLIIGILAAIILPQHQRAVDKAKYTKMIPFTKSLIEAHMRASMIKENPSFDDLDFDIPANCTVSDDHRWALSCVGGAWGCLIRRQSSGSKYWIRCTDKNLNASYFYTVYLNGVVERRCYAHTTDENDRPNRLCKAITNKTNKDVTEDIAMFWQPNGPWVNSNGYSF